MEEAKFPDLSRQAPLPPLGRTPQKGERGVYRLERASNSAIFQAMKLDPDSSLSSRVFRNYGSSWTAVRQAAKRVEDGFLVIPLNPPAPDEASETPASSPRTSRARCS